MDQSETHQEQQRVPETGPSKPAAVDLHAQEEAVDEYGAPAPTSADDMLERSKNNNDTLHIST